MRSFLTPSFLLQIVVRDLVVKRLQADAQDMGCRRFVPLDQVEDAFDVGPFDVSHGDGAANDP